MKHRATNTGLLIDPDGQWIKVMTSHVLGARWLSHWPHTDLWVTEPCHQGAGFGGDVEANWGIIKGVSYLCESWLVPGSDLKHENRYAYQKLEQFTEGQFGEVH